MPNDSSTPTNTRELCNAYEFEQKEERVAYVRLVGPQKKVPER